MGYALFWVICMVSFGTLTSDSISLPCGASLDSIQGVFWPDIDNGTCSTSIPGCTDSEGRLDIRCCVNGKPTDTNCVKNDTIYDPRCLGNMSSTVSNTNVRFCYELVHDTKYPFECMSKTGLMIDIGIDSLKYIAGTDMGIWLPIEKYDNFRYVSVNHSYMDAYIPLASINSSDACVVLMGNESRAVSCNERHLGICLDFPFIVHKMQPESDLEVLLNEVEDYCSNSNQEFCLYFRQRYNMNLVYFSSRQFVSDPHMILQKSNLRLILEIRKDDPLQPDGTIYLHVGLDSSDWEIFKNTSFYLTHYDATDESLYETPKVILSISGDSISIEKINSNNIKWTQTEEYMHYIFCFFSSTPGYHPEKFEVLDTHQLDLKNKSGIIWCDAFDHDLNIISSNVVSLGNQVTYYYISKMIVSIDGVKSCDISTIRERIIDSIIGSKDDKNFYFDTKHISIVMCHPFGTAEVDMSVYWYPKVAAEQLDVIEEEYERLKKVIQGISEKFREKHWNISSSELHHSDYCMKEARAIGDFSFFWPTTASYSNSSSYPSCYKNHENFTEIFRRKCSKSSLGSFWLDIGDDDYCEPVANLTLLLQEIHLCQNLTKTGVLNNLNVAIWKYHPEFHVHDVNIMSKILSQLDGGLPNVEENLKNLSRLINNLHFIKTDVLKISQDKYQTTDTIMNSSDNMYVSNSGSQNLTETNHCYYTINFTEHPNASGIVLRISDSSYDITLLESSIPPIESLEDDNFEAVIYFNQIFLRRLKEYKNAIMKFSIFFNNYLFDINHPSVTTKTIFKVLPPEEIKLQSFSTFLTVKNQKGEETCACWKYGSTQNGLVDKKWHRTNKFETDSHSSCIYRSASYCTVFKTESEGIYRYISGLLVQYSSSLDNHLDIFSVIIEEICNLLYMVTQQYGHGLTYELRPIKTLSHRIIEMVVVWNPTIPAQTVPEIEKEYGKLKQAVGKLSSYDFSNNNIIDWLNVEYLRHSNYCLKDVYNYDWSTRFIFGTTALDDDVISSPICYTDGDVVRRKCIGNEEIGSFWEDLNPQSFKNCFSYVTETLKFLLEHFADSNANDVLNDLEQMTEKSTVDFNSIDINLLSDVLFLVSRSTDSQDLDVQSVSAITSNLQGMEKDALRKAQVQYNATDKILDSLDRMLLRSNVTLNKKARFCTVPLRNLDKAEALIVQRDGSDYKISVEVGAVNNPYLLDEYKNFEGAVFFNGFNREDSIIVSIFFEDVLFVDSNWNQQVSLVFSILLPNHNETSSLPGDIELVFKSHKGMDHSCAYWKYGFDRDVNISGRWKNESRPHERYEYSTCKFNHTTHFAMLIEDDDNDPAYLRIVTNVGCCLSILGLLGILITGIIFERWRKNVGNIILMNFVFTVAVQICLYYLSGMSHKFINESYSCVLIGALLHYSVISEFCWMLIIAILQFKRFVQVLTRRPKYVLLKSFLVGWGLPVIPVLALLLIDPKSYTSTMTGLCYPSKLGLYLTVWLPILVITMINFVIFSYIMYSIFNRKTECVDTVSNEIVFQWRLAVLLFFMLGLTWTFAILSEFILKEIFEYLFCITGTLQGFIMFLFFIVFNERTRLLYSVMFGKIIK